MSDEEQHTLTYAGKVNPDAGTFLGPDTSGNYWVVLGAMHDPGDNKTGVLVQKFEPPT